jgi:hypothetical protein
LFSSSTKNSQIINEASFAEVVEPGNSMRLYPNPTADYVNIDISGIEARQYDVYVFNAVGQVVRTIKVSTNETHNLFVGELNKGMYFMKALNDNGSVLTQKLIVE